MGTSLGIRGLQKTKSSNITVGTDIPSNGFGNSGDIAIRNVDGVIRLYAKYGGDWYGRDLGPTLVVGDVNRKHTVMDSNGVQIKDGRGKTVSTFTDTVTIGEVGSGLSNVHITSGSIKLRNNLTDKVTIDTSGNATFDGSLTVKGEVDFGGSIAGKGIVLEGGTGASDYTGMLVTGHRSHISIGERFNGDGEASIWLFSEDNNNGSIIFNDSDADSSKSFYIGREGSGTSSKFQIGTGYNVWTVGGTAAIEIDDDRTIKLPSVYSNTVTGTFKDVEIKTTGEIGTDTSSSVFKGDIRNSSNMLSTINDLRVVSYKRKVLDSDGMPTDTLGLDIEYGLLAEELSSRIPSVCYKATSSEKSDFSLTTDYIGISYKKLVPFLIKAVQELSDKVDTLEGYHVGR